jgi:hypothetical protein
MSSKTIRQWNLAMQCVDNGAEYFCNGQWLDQYDRRVRKALAREQWQQQREQPKGKFTSTGVLA